MGACLPGGPWLATRAVARAAGRRPPRAGSGPLLQRSADRRKFFDLSHARTIENGLHWVRDVTFDEDRSQVRKGKGPQVMATLRNLAISILRLAGALGVARALRWCARDHRRVMRLVGLAP